MGRRPRAALPVSAPENYFVISGPASLMDTVGSVFGSAPFVALVTTGVIFVVVTAAFGSVVIPLRLLPSIAATLIWTYGLAVAVYQDGVLAWTGVQSLMPIAAGIAPGVSWVVPIASLTILPGLSLDYDIFILGHIAEFRLAGFSDHDAVVLGVSATGSTVTAAGAIMVIAFSGLLMSGQMLLNQISFFMLMSVIIDTLVMRTIVVPVSMDLLSRASNWWPKPMPQPTRKVGQLSGPPSTSI